MDNIERALKLILYRLECPSKMDLGEYDLGLLDIFRRNEIAAGTQSIFKKLKISIPKKILSIEKHP